MTFLYESGIRIFLLVVRLAAFFNRKARLWVEGRRNWRERYALPGPPEGGRALTLYPKRRAAPPGAKPFSPSRGGRGGLLWIHAASLGEFEQGRPVIEAFREQFPGWRVVLTFFSPSGYEIRHNYPHAELVCYLPADTRRNAVDFLNLIRPDAAIFVKYDFWANYLFELKKRRIPTILISSVFRKSQPFFRWYGGFWRKMLDCFTHIFVQNEASARLLQDIGFQNITVAGDTRIDRVLKIAESAPENEIVAAFAPPGRGEIRPVHGISVNQVPPPSDGQGGISSNDKESHALPPLGGTGGAFIAGSSWEADEELFLSVLKKPHFQNFKIIIAPHDPGRAAQVFKSAQKAFADLKAPVILYSRATPETARAAQVLIIDNVGILNSLYRYAAMAYIGGGFGKGLHNTLEPAAWGLPVIFGPNYTKFEEARCFVATGGAFPVHKPEELAAVLEKLRDRDFYKKASEAVSSYLEHNKGATDQVLAFLKARL